MKIFYDHINDRYYTKRRLISFIKDSINKLEDDDNDQGFECDISPLDLEDDEGEIIE